MLTLRRFSHGLDGLKCLIAAKVSNLPLKDCIDDKNGLNFVQLDLEDGTALCDPTTIALYLASDSLARKGQQEQYSQVLQWLNLGISEIRPFHYMKSSLSGPNDSCQASHVKRILEGCNSFLRMNTYLVGERLSLADIGFAIELTPIWPKFKSMDSLPHLRRWFRTVANQDSVKEVLDLEQWTPPTATPSKQMSKKPKKEKTEAQKKKPGANSPALKLKLLCLHGYRQNEATFKEKIGAFRKIVNKVVDLTFFSAPLQVPTADDGETDPRGWWFSQASDVDSFNAHQFSDCDKGFIDTMQTLSDVVAKEGPFDGIFAFSQGSALLAILCLMQEKGELPFEPFKFAIMVAPFKSRSTAHAKWFKEPVTQVRIPSLLVVGDSDKVIEREMSDEVLKYFESPVVLRHPGGHFVPASGPQKKVYLEFLGEMQKRFTETAEK